MKFPKNRASVYVVIRRGTHDDAVVGVFADFDEANDYSGACEQQWLEKTHAKVLFDVVLSTFYG